MSHDVQHGESGPPAATGRDASGPELLAGGRRAAVRLAAVPDAVPANVLDGANATVRNAQWRKVICAESLEARA